MPMPMPMRAHPLHRHEGRGIYRKAGGPQSPGRWHARHDSLAGPPEHAVELAGEALRVPEQVVYLDNGSLLRQLSSAELAQQPHEAIVELGLVPAVEMHPSPARVAAGPVGGRGSGAKVGWQAKRAACRRGAGRDPQLGCPFCTSGKQTHAVTMRCVPAALVLTAGQNSALTDRLGRECWGGQGASSSSPVTVARR